MSNLKRIKVLAICSALIISQMASISANAFFGGFNMGVVNHWAEPFMRSLYLNDLLKGDENGNMLPNNNITRAEFVTMINRAFSYDNVYGDPFSDVEGNEWYANDLITAFNEGYFEGTDGDALANQKLTREEAVIYTCKNLGIMPISGHKGNFTDSEDFSSESQGYINIAAQKGFIAGYPDGSFRPQGNITRAEASKFLDTAFGELIMDPGTHYFGRIDGNATIATSNVTLEDTTITGDLYITSGVELGHINLDNVRVLGEVIVSGSGQGHEGESSVNIKDSDIEMLSVTGTVPKSIKTSGDTVIKHTNVYSDAFLEDGATIGKGFMYVELNGPLDTELYVTGNFDKITVVGPENILTINNAYVQSLVIDEKAVNSIVETSANVTIANLLIDAPCNINGEARIYYAKVNSPNVVIEPIPDIVEVRPGITVEVGGETLDYEDALNQSSEPRLLTDYPIFKDLGPDSVTLLFKTNKTSTVYYAITPVATSTLTTEEVLSPNKFDTRIAVSGTVKATANTEVKADIKKLAPDAVYTLYIVVEDENGKTSTKYMIEFRTTDDTEMEFIDTFPKVTEVSKDSLTLSMIPKRDTTAYYAILPKNSVEPSAESLRTMTVSGALEDGSTRIYKNTEKTHIFSGLDERTEYDIYVLLYDEGMYSEVYYVNAETSDETAPLFLANYPKVTNVLDKEVELTVNVDEDATMYYAIYYNGTAFPAPNPPSIDIPSMDSDEAKDQVILGNASVKKGKSTLKANTDTVVKLSGLEPETAYDVYLVLEDRYGNQDEVRKVDIKTFDNIIPTATVEFSDVLDGDVMTSSEIRIVFSEEVFNSVNFKPFTEEPIGISNLTLYDNTESRPETIPIDFTKVTAILEDQKTKIIIPPEALNLENGRTYQFELNNITDSSNNKMSQKTKLPEFTTISPFVEIYSLPSDEYHLTFEIDPISSQTPDDILYDLIFTSDVRVSMNIFEIVDGDDIPLVRSQQIVSGTSRTLANMMNMSSYDFKIFNDLTAPRTFGINFTAVDGISDANSTRWNADVDLDIKLVIGSKQNLTNIADSPDRNLDIALDNGAIISSYPKDFSMTKIFIDGTQPEFIPEYPKLDIDSGDGIDDDRVFDTYIAPVVRVDRPSRIYYLVAPTGTVESPDPYKIMDGTFRPSDAAVGFLDIENANTNVELLIEDLEPGTKYDFFYFLKGVPADPTDIEEVGIITKLVSPPVFESVILDPQTTSADVRFELDKEATIYWVVYREQSQPTFEDDTEDGRNELINYIVNGTDFGSVEVTAKGTVEAKKGSSDTAVVTDNIEGLSLPNEYVLYAVAQVNTGDEYSEVYITENTFSPVDKEPPDVTVSTVTNIETDGTYVAPYDGAFTITFNEPIYYKVDETSDSLPLTSTFFNDNIDVIGMELSTTFSSKTGKTGGDLSLQQITYKFSNAQPGATLTFPYIMSDKNGNAAGKFSMTLVKGEPHEMPKFVVNWQQ